MNLIYNDGIRQLLVISIISLLLLMFSNIKDLVRDNFKTMTDADDLIDDIKMVRKVAVADLVKMLADVAAAPPLTLVNETCKPDSLPKYLILFLDSNSSIVIQST